MAEFFNVLPPALALAELFKHLPASVHPESILTVDALDRVTAEPVRSPAALPAFPRSTMDGYAVRAQDTFGASATLPASGATVIEAGRRLRPQDLGGLMALGITSVMVARRPTFAILATGDEVVPPESHAGPGQIRDINSYSVGGLVQRAGGLPVRYGIAPDNFNTLITTSTKALSECDGLILSAGSSVSVRDMTGDVINRLGKPGVLVHGVAVKPGKPTLLAVCDGKPVFGLPGNPVSALVIAELFVKPTIERMLGLRESLTRRVRAKLTRNIASEAGREDYVPARLVERDGEMLAEPVFGKSNLIFTLIRADGIIHIPLNANGVSEGEMVEVRLF
ncbi:MAG: molybdopterin molybdotransferase MoeA [Chloroflexi bacterium]|nr:molybdopterin molybdotransferase MoeA [Chloroflexota bacterium]